MSLIGPHPLGSTITGSPHSVCVSLPTMADIVGYEERLPETMRHLGSGYPRFLRHPFIERVLESLRRRHHLGDAALYPVADVGALEVLRGFVGDGVAHAIDGWHVLAIAAHQTQACTRARQFCTHTGIGVSSREAEDWLHAHGELEKVWPEAYFTGADADLHVRQTLAGIYGSGIDPADIWICRGGMNAFYAGFRALSQVLVAEGRTLWIQLGWLYVDTIRILEKCGVGGCAPVVLHNVHDLEMLERVLEEHGARVAGIVTEVPTNPLVQTADLPRLRALADRHDCALVLDPTIASPHNVEVLPFADLHINSLTKYAAGEGDVMLGALALGPQSRFRDALRGCIDGVRARPYARDLARLALEIGAYHGLVDAINANTRIIAAQLAAHPAVERVWWAHAPETEANYRRIQRPGAGPGCMITFTLRGGRAALDRFYDAVALPKSPSFGLGFPLLCPFMYLAHYEQVTTESGRADLRAAGLPPELVRLSCGVGEPAAQWQPLRAALDALV